MQSNLEKFKEDLDDLSTRGKFLLLALQYRCNPASIREAYGDKFSKLEEILPDFGSEYQSWYSESKALIKQMLPDRLEDFSRHYEKPKSRKDISYENYRIEDCLQSLVVTRGLEKKKVVGPDAAITHMEQQLAIVKAVYSRFESSLFDIRQLVQADLFDSELASAYELLKCGFLRGAGAIAGVVLEKHLSQVSINHDVKTRKKNPSISDFNDLLKNQDIIDTPEWRRIQRLGDIRNLCDHNKEREPTKDEVQELLDGTEKVIKTLF